jgi:hypothetical protein
VRFIGWWGLIEINEVNVHVPGMKAERAEKVQLHSFLILILKGGKWLASCSSYFITRERVPVTH